MNFIVLNELNSSKHASMHIYDSAQNIILYYFLFKVNQKEWKGINELFPYFGFQETEFIDIYTVSLCIDGLQEPHSWLLGVTVRCMEQSTYVPTLYTMISYVVELLVRPHCHHSIFAFLRLFLRFLSIPSRGCKSYYRYNGCSHE